MIGASWINGSKVQPIRLVNAVQYGSGGKFSVAVQSATTVRTLYRFPFIIGSGDVSSLILSFNGWYIGANSGVASLGNIYTVKLCSIEYNSTYSAVKFSGSREKVISSGDTDIQSDEIYPSSFSLNSFSRGSTGYVRVMLEFSSPATDSSLNGPFRMDSGTNSIIYDASKATITNGVDSTGEFSFTGANGGTFGVDILQENTLYTPFVLGRFVSGDPGVWIAAGDSGTAGDGDTRNSIWVQGSTRAFFPDPTVATNAIANLNFGIGSGIATDWANGSTSLLYAHLKYFNRGFEKYGGNALNASASAAIHTQMRSAGITKIVRPSLTPKGTSTDSWATEGNQTATAGWSNGGSADTFEQAMQALVASDLTYFEGAALRGSTHWLWKVNGTPFYSTPDGLHPSATGYEFFNGGTGSIIASGGTTSGTLRGLISSLS